MSFVNEQQRKEERIALEQSSLGYLLTIASDEKELTKLLLRLQKIDWLDPVHRQIFKALLDGRLSHARIVEGLSFNRIQVPEGQVSAFDYLLRLEEQALGAYLVEELYRLDAEEKISTSLKASDYETAHRQLMLMMTGEGSVPDLQILRFSDLKKMSGPEWLIEGYLPKHALCTLYGESGSYKSFIALDMCLSIALDQNWAGRRVSSGKIAYIAGEGEKGLRNRVEGWLAKNHH